MKTVYKCEYCDEISEDYKAINKHELKCGHNPKNQINDKNIYKIAITKNKFEDALVYVLLNDYFDKLDYFSKELGRVDTHNCQAVIFENTGYLKHLIYRVNRLEKKEIKWFNEITERDCIELINAIRTCIKLPVFRINDLESKGE